MTDKKKWLKVSVLVCFILALCLVLAAFVNETFVRMDRIYEDTKDLKDYLEEEMEDESTIIGLYGGYSYSISNIDLNLSLAVSVLNETAYINITYQCEFYLVSCLLNEDMQYDLKIAIVGMYINATILTSEGISGGSVTIDEFYYKGVVDECTQESIQDALSEVMELEQWSS